MRHNEVVQKLQSNFSTTKNLKESGIPWVGKIPEHWEMRKIKYILDYKKGKNPKSFSDTPNENIYLTMEFLRRKYKKIFYIEDTSDLIRVSEGDILLLWDGANAGEFILAQDGYLASTMAVINFNGVEKDYAKHFLVLIEKELRSQTNGMGIPHVSGSLFENLFFALPPLEEQKAIADFLDKKTRQIEEFITKKQKLITLLEEKKQTLINQCVTQGLDSPTSLKDSGVEWLGKIPTHWEMTKIKHFCEINPQTNQEIPNHFTYIDLESVTKGVLWKKQVISKEQAPSRAQRILQKKDILFQLVRPYQKNNYLFDEDGDYVASTGYAQVRTREYAKFIYYAFLEDSLIQRIALKCTGSNYPAITSSDFGDLKIPLPPLEEQKAIAEYLDTQIEKIDLAICKIKSQINLIKEYKTTLISEAVCGRVGRC